MPKTARSKVEAQERAAHAREGLKLKRAREATAATAAPVDQSLVTRMRLGGWRVATREDLAAGNTTAAAAPRRPVPLADMAAAGSSPASGGVLLEPVRLLPACPCLSAVPPLVPACLIRGT